MTKKVTSFFYRQYTQIHNDLFLVDFEILFFKNFIIILLIM